MYGVVHRYGTRSFQNSEPVDPFLSCEREKRSQDPADRAKPRHSRLEGWTMSSSSSSSAKLQSMVGNAMDSSTCFDETSKADMSNESKEERDRFMEEGLIMGF